MLKKRRGGGWTPLLSSPQKSPAAALHPLLCCWLLCRLWQPASAGLDFLTKPLGVRAATAASGWCARPKLTQQTSLFVVVVVVVGTHKEVKGQMGALLSRAAEFDGSEPNSWHWCQTTQWIVGTLKQMACDHAMKCF